MPDFPDQIGGGRLQTLSTLSPRASQIAWSVLCSNVLMTTSTAWPAADRAIFVPVHLEYPGKVFQISVMNGATANGTTDVGIYNEDFVRKVSIGPTTQTGTSTIQTFDVADTLLSPGIYYLGLLNSGSTGTYLSGTITAIRGRASGMVEQSSVASSTLPNPAVPVTFTGLLAPVIVAHLKATV